MFLHDFTRDRQSQTEAKGSAVFLGGEVGFEYAFQVFGVYAFALIRYRYDNRVLKASDCDIDSFSNGRGIHGVYKEVCPNLV